jgi:hypothetical protein
MTENVSQRFVELHCGLCISKLCVKQVGLAIEMNLPCSAVSHRNRRLSDWFVVLECCCRPGPCHWWSVVTLFCDSSFMDAVVSLLKTVLAQCEHKL